MRSEHCCLPQRARHQAQDLILRKVVGRHQRKSIPENVMETVRTVLLIMVTDTADGTTDIAIAKDAYSAATNVMVEEIDKRILKGETRANISNERFVEAFRG